MSDVKRFHLECFIDNYYTVRPFVLASDYDRLELECADLRASLDGYKNCMRLMVEESTCADWSGENDESIFATAQTWCGKYQHANQERDELRAQVEVMRTENESARRTGAFWKDEKICADAVIDQLRVQIEAMLAAPANERATAFEACPESNCDWGAFYRGWMARAALQAKP